MPRAGSSRNRKREFGVSLGGARSGSLQSREKGENDRISRTSREGIARACALAHPARRSPCPGWFSSCAPLPPPPTRPCPSARGGTRQTLWVRALQRHCKLTAEVNRAFAPGFSMALESTLRGAEGRERANWPPEMAPMLVGTALKSARHSPHHASALEHPEHDRCDHRLHNDVAHPPHGAQTSSNKSHKQFMGRQGCGAAGRAGNEGQVGPEGSGLGTLLAIELNAQHHAAGFSDLHACSDQEGQERALCRKKSAVGEQHQRRRRQQVRLGAAMGSVGCDARLGSPTNSPAPPLTQNEASLEAKCSKMQPV